MNGPRTKAGKALLAEAASDSSIIAENVRRAILAIEAEAAVPGVSGEADPMSDRAVSSEESDR